MQLKTPPMGWNTWNTFGENINETIVLETVDKMVELGYKEAGYEYVIIDDCWSEHKRDENGRLAPDRKKFPHGMKYIADYIHSKGLKFGMYSDAGFWTCAGYPSSFGHEVLDAQTFAEWEIDYLKYDFGFFPGNARADSTYLIMSQALRMTGRDIVFAACCPGAPEKPMNWARSRGCQTYRSTDDIVDTRKSYMEIIESQLDCVENNTIGCFNDMDMLTVGMYGRGNAAADGGVYEITADSGAMTYTDYETQFLTWAFLGSPLIIGGDIRNLDGKSRKLLQNKEVIAINQDTDAGTPFRVEKYYEHGHIMCKLLSGGDIAILAINFHPETNVQKSIKLKIAFDDVGIRTGSGYGYEFTNVLTGEVLGTFEAGYGIDVNSENCILLRGKPVKL